MFRFEKPTKLCFNHVHGEKASSMPGLPKNSLIMAESDHLTKIKLFELPSPGSDVKIEVTDEIIQTDTMFENLLNCEDSHDKAKPSHYPLFVMDLKHQVKYMRN